MARDFLVVSSDQGSIQMYDKITFQLLDAANIAEYVVNSMCLQGDDRIVMGHEAGMLTLWDTSREVLNN